MLRRFLFILTVTLLCNCARKVNVESKPELKFYFTTSQTWVGGHIGSGKGINYQFFLSVADSSYQFDSAWVNGYRLSLNRNSELSTNETLVLNAAAFFPSPEKNNANENSIQKNPELATPPVYTEAKVVVRFSLKEKKYFLFTNELKPLKGIYYR
ncbi:MAG: hypothetical protein WCI97_01315 [Bacteroidota bacterium]